MTRHILYLVHRSSGWCRLAILLVMLTAAPSGSHGAQPASAQKVFSSPEDARQAFVAAARTRDITAQQEIFGPAAREMATGNPVEDAAEAEQLARHIEEGVELLKEGDDKAILVIGTKKWPFPVPLVKKGDVWLFDTVSGREEILNRRIGHNELLAIKACRAYVEAQREYYAMEEPDGDQLPKYAQKMISSPGRRDGLYWPTAEGAKESPLGQQVAKAKEEGYMQQRKAGEQGPRPFHGYYFRILKRQGVDAPGGKFDYVINNNMVAGFALVAYPARWGVSGVMTFIVNQRGRVYQKNLGPKSAEIVRKMKAYNPDLSWKLVQEE